MTTLPSVLIVEDEALVAMELHDRLTQLGYTVLGKAARGERALELLADRTPDLVLMDIRLAGALNGIETAARLRARYDVPVVFLTAYCDAELLRQAGEVQPFGYLVKPFDERELHATLQMALYKHRMERELREANARLEERVRERTLELARSEALNLAILDSITLEIAVLDGAGRIVAVNEPWRRFARENSLEPGKPVANTEIGDNYLSACPRPAHDDGECVDADCACEGIRAVLDGRLPRFTLEYPCHSPTQQRWFTMVVSPLGTKGDGVVIAHTDITDRKLAALALRDSEESLAITLNSIGDGVLATDAHGRVTRLNPVAEALTGWSMEEALGRDVAEIFNVVDAHSRQPTVLPVGEVLRTGRSVEMTGRTLLLARDGRERPIADSAAPIRDRNGDIRGAVLVFRDQTRELQAQQAAHERERLLSSINQNLDGAFVYQMEFSPDGRISYNYVSPNVEKVTGLSPAELLQQGERIYSLFPPEELPPYQALIAHSLRTDEQFDVEVPLRHAVDGSLRWLRVRARNIERRADGTVVREGISMDVTAAKEAAAENRMLALVAARTVNGVVVTDPARRIEWVNEGFTRISGYTLEEVRGRVPGTFLQGGKTSPAAVARIREALQSGRGCHAELVNYAKDGREYWVDIEIQPLLDAAGRLTHYMAIEKDITERKAAEQALRLTAASLVQRTEALEAAREAAERAQLSKTRFFAAASHDLLQPLNAARIFASSLAERRDLSPASVQIAERIDAALRSAEEVIDVLVSVVKLDTGAVRAVVEDVDLGELLRGLVAQFSSIAERRQLQLRIGPCDVTIRSDRRLLRRVFQNLISNALRYTSRGGVLVGVRRLPDARVRVDVVDTGAGIPSEALPSAFEEFHRVGRGSPWGEKGLGLGLSICRRICTLLGHELTATSAVDRGSVFSVAVGSAVRRLAPRESALSVIRPAQAQPGLSLRVLCVDDDADVLDAMITLISGWGAEVGRARSRSTAIEAARLRRPDVVLVDYQFEGDDICSGLEIIAALRELYPQQPPAAILITANRADDLQAIARAEGVPLLHKPLRAARLRSLLEAVSRQ